MTLVCGTLCLFGGGQRCGSVRGEDRMIDCDPGVALRMFVLVPTKRGHRCRSVGGEDRMIDFQTFSSAVS